MQPTFQFINPQYFLVRVNRQKQYDKRMRQGTIFLAPSATFMARNQQCGEIVAMGEGVGITEYREDHARGGMVRFPIPTAREVLPQAQVGDTLLFSHLIEGSVETKDEAQVEYDTRWLTHEDEAWRYYWVKWEFAYGVVKKDGTIFVTPDTIFAQPAAAEVDSRDQVKVGNLYLLKNFKESHDAMQQRIEELKALAVNYNDKRQAKVAQDEMEKLTNEKNKPRLAAFTPVVVNEKFNRDCGRTVDDSDVLFYQIIGARTLDLQVLSLEYEGRTFYVLRPDYVVAVQKIPQMYVGEAGLKFLNEEGQ